MKLFQTYQNNWAYCIPISYEDKVVEFIWASKPDCISWEFKKQDMRENEVDVVFPDSNLTDLPRTNKIDLVKDVFIKREYYL